MGRKPASLPSARRAALLIALISIFGVGCGGGSSDTTTRSQGQPNAGPSPKADYVAVADTICSNHQSRREDLESQARELGPITTAKRAHRIAALLRKESANRVAEVAELESRRPPSAAAATRILRLIRAQATLIEDWARAYDDLDWAAIRRLQIRLGALTAKTGDRARAYGFRVCGQQ